MFNKLRCKNQTLLSNNLMFAKEIIKAVIVNGRGCSVLVVITSQN